MPRTAFARVIEATPAARDELAFRRIAEILDATERKIDDNLRDFGGFRGKLEKARRAVDDRRIKDAQDLRDDLLAAIALREYDLETAAAMEAQERHHEIARGEETITADSGQKTRDGFLWLRRKGRVAGPRAEAGQRFREHYARLDPSVKSSLASLNRVDGGTGGVAAPEGFSMARFEVDGVRDHIRQAVGNDRGSYLYSLLVEVCAKGVTVRKMASNGDRESDRIVAELCFALDMAASRFGMVKS